MAECPHKQILRATLANKEAEERARFLTGSIDDDVDAARHLELQAKSFEFFSEPGRRASYWAHAASIALNGAISALGKTDAFGQMSKKEICTLLVETMLEEQLIRNWHDKPGRI